MKGEYVNRANEEWNTIQKIERVSPGTRVGPKISQIDKIDRADLAVLFIDELKLVELFEKYNVTQFKTDFKPYSEDTDSQKQSKGIPDDIIDHWAKNWIIDILNIGAMEVFPGNKFYPDDYVTRANFSRLIQKILVMITKDYELETKYLGEPSRFPDMSSSHYAYNAVALCVDRGIIQADLKTGAFKPNDTVSGVEALEIIKKFQNLLRQTF